MQQGLERVKNCSAAGEVLQPLQPLLLPAAVPSLTFGPPAQKKQDKMVLCAIPVCQGVEQLALASPGFFQILRATVQENFCQLGTLCLDPAPPNR